MAWGGGCGREMRFGVVMGWCGMRSRIGCGTDVTVGWMSVAAAITIANWWTDDMQGGGNRSEMKGDRRYTPTIGG